MEKMPILEEGASGAEERAQAEVPNRNLEKRELEIKEAVDQAFTEAMMKGGSSAKMSKDGAFPLSGLWRPAFIRAATDRIAQSGLESGDFDIIDSNIDKRVSEDEVVIKYSPGRGKKDKAFSALPKDEQNRQRVLEEIEQGKWGGK